MYREITGLKAWQEDYQELCDRFYWQHGPCCAGCDHWMSEAALIGTCNANGVFSGKDVMRSLGFESSSYTPPPGFPFVRHDFFCGKFKDNFDWSELDKNYLKKIGATDSDR